MENEQQINTIEEEISAESGEVLDDNSEFIDETNNIVFTSTSSDIASVQLEMKKCIYCNSKMLLDDIDYNFKGNKDNYWKCENCGATAYEKIRFNKSLFTEFEKGEDINEK